MPQSRTAGSDLSQCSIRVSSSLGVAVHSLAYNRQLQCSFLFGVHFSSLSVLLFSRSQLHHLQGDLFGAGLDTTLTNLKWILLCLAKHQDLQEQVRKEIEEKVADAETGARLSDLENLPFTQVSFT